MTISEIVVVIEVQVLLYNAGLIFGGTLSSFFQGVKIASLTLATTCR